VTFAAAWTEGAAFALDDAIDAALWFAGAPARAV